MTASKKRPRTYRNCRACRERHAKCDDRASACRYCLWNDIECVRQVDIRFRSSESRGRGTFPPDQTWLPQHPDLQYRNETSEVAKPHTKINAEVQKLSELVAIGSSRRKVAGHGDFQHPTCETGAENSDIALENGAQMVVDAFTENPAPITESFVVLNEQRRPDLSSNLIHAQQVVFTQDDVGRIRTSEPFTPREAELLRNFAENMALWADVTDYERNFEYEVPRRTLYSPVLRFAVLAFSSRHINRFMEGSNSEALQYHNRCLELLIPVLSEQGKEMTDDILAAIGILRMDEEMEDFDTECHLRGAIRILNQTPVHCTRGGLGEAAAWLCLRQDMYISLIHQQNLRVRPNIFEGSKSLIRVDDLGWTNKMVLLLARILSIIYDRAGQKADELYSLDKQVDNWMRDKPPTFDPILNLPRDKKIARRTPILWMLSPTQVIGLQYFHIAKLILAATANFHANNGRFSFQRGKDMEKRVRKHLLAIIGLASSNPRAENALFMARHMLLVWGGVLTDELDQIEVEHFLSNMEQRTGWSARSLIADLAEQWNSSDNEG